MQKLYKNLTWILQEGKKWNYEKAIYRTHSFVKDRNLPFYEWLSHDYHNGFIEGDISMIDEKVYPLPLNCTVEEAADHIVKYGIIEEQEFGEESE